MVSLRVQGIIALGASLQKVNASLLWKMRTHLRSKQGTLIGQSMSCVQDVQDVQGASRCIVKASLLGLLRVSTSGAQEPGAQPDK